MDPEQLRCFRCGELGHISAGCPKHAQLQLTAPSVALPWCGQCDPRTRLMRGVEPVSRCLDCHRERRKMLLQHRRCKICRRMVYVWDVADCDKHQTMGPQPYIGKPAEPPAIDRASEASRQVSEARAARQVLP